MNNIEMGLKGFGRTMIILLCSVAVVIVGIVCGLGYLFGIVK